MRGNLDGGGCFPTGRHYPGIAHLLRIVAAGLVEELDAQMATHALPLVAIDTETTGRDPTVDRIIEVACVLYDQGKVIARHSWLVNPGVSIPEEAWQVHGIRDEDVQDKPGFAAIVSELIACLEGRIPVAYNAEFDRNFLIAELGRVGIPGDKRAPALRKGVEWIDPLIWARELQKEEKSRSLGDVAERLGVELARAHRATDDAEATVQILNKFFEDPRLPKNYGAFIQEQKRLSRNFSEERQHWRPRLPTSGA